MAAAAAGGGSATDAVEWGDQTLLSYLYSIYKTIPHSPHGNTGGFTVKSGQTMTYMGRPYYIIVKGARTFEDLKNEFEITKYVSDSEYGSARHVGKLVAVKLNPIPLTTGPAHRKYSGIFVFDLEDSQAIDLYRYLRIGLGVKIDVSYAQIYNDLHEAVTSLHRDVAVIHRDLKPQNIILLYKMYDSDGKLIRSLAGYPYVGLRIIDFGLAVEEASSVTPAGTPGYMPDPYPSKATPNINKYALNVIAEKNLKLPRSIWRTRKGRKGRKGRKSTRFRA